MRALCIFLLALVACGKKPEPGSCYRQQDNVCIEYSAEQGAAGKHLCAGQTWTAGADSCAKTNRLGKCTKKDVSELYFGGAPNNYDHAGATTACQHGGGTFVRD